MRLNKLALVLSVAILALAVAPSRQASLAQGGVELTVTSAFLNVRSGPGTTYDIIGRLTCGQKVVADARTTDGSWYRINYNGRQAFVFAQFAAPNGTCNAAGATTAPTAAPAAGAMTGVVTSDMLNVRAGPSTGNAILGRLRRGDQVAVKARTQDGAWLQIDYNGRDAFVFAQYVSLGGAAPAAQPAPAPAPRSGNWTFELGGHIKTTNYLAQMRDIGMTWVKYQVVMPGGTPDVSWLVNAVHGAGMKLLIGAVGDRARASDPNYHREFAAALAGLARQGVDAIEVWNEPNLDREYGGSGNGQVNPENYANMLREAYTAIKAANPNVLVIGGATAPTGFYGGGCSAAGCDDKPFVERLAAAGGAQWMDCMGAHHNGTMVGPDQTSGAPVGSSDHHQWYFWGTLNVNWNAFGGKVPICWTELGYVSGEGIGPLPAGFAWGSSITLANQAQWLARAAQLSRESGKVRLMIIWNIDFRQWDDDPQAGYSIFRPDGSCPACATLRQVMGR